MTHLSICVDYLILIHITVEHLLFDILELTIRKIVKNEMIFEAVDD